MASCWTLSKPHMPLKESRVTRSVITSGTQPFGTTGKVSTSFIILVENVQTESDPNESHP